MTVVKWMVLQALAGATIIAFLAALQYPSHHNERKVMFPGCPEIPIRLSLARLLVDFQCDRDMLSKTCGTPDHPKPEGCELPTREIPKAERER
jgi:hypothetical protein